MKLRSSLDIGNSSIKYATMSDPIVKQLTSAFRPSTRHTIAREDSPVVLLPDGTSRQWGIAATTSPHTLLAEVNKADFALECLAAVAGQGHHSLNLTISHHNPATAREMASNVTGQHRLSIDTGMGFEECFLDVIASPILEGEGTYKLLSSQLGPDAVVVEVGFRTSELLVYRKGQLATYEPDASLGVQSILRSLDSASRLDSDISDLTDLDYQIRSGNLNTPGLQEACKAWYKRLAGNFSAKLRLSANSRFCFTGGGAALLRSLLPEIADKYVLPTNPETASVLGGLL